MCIQIRNLIMWERDETWEGVTSLRRRQGMGLIAHCRCGLQPGPWIVHALPLELR